MFYSSTRLGGKGGAKGALIVTLALDPVNSRLNRVANSNLLVIHHLTMFDKDSDDEYDGDGYGMDVECTSIV
jgi:hypothetical protein